MRTARFIGIIAFIAAVVIIPTLCFAQTDSTTVMPMVTTILDSKVPEPEPVLPDTFVYLVRRKSDGREEWRFEVPHWTVVRVHTHRTYRDSLGNTVAENLLGSQIQRFIENQRELPGTELDLRIARTTVLVKDGQVVRMKKWKKRYEKSAGVILDLEQRMRQSPPFPKGAIQ